MAEKEYVLGNKTKDLLVYTFVVTKPIGDKTLELSEVIKMMETILGLPQEAKDDLIREYIDRMKKANSKQGFPKSALHTYIKTTRETAVSIVRNIHAANDCSFQTEYDRRLDLIHAALNDCNLLLKLVEISQALGYPRSPGRPRMNTLRRCRASHGMTGYCAVPSGSTPPRR